MSPRSATRVQLPAKSGSLEGAIAEPLGEGKVGALVVIQEWHGVNDQMRRKVERFASEGYLALCPDLYHGKVATNDEEAGRLMGGLDWARALGEIEAAVKYLREHPRCSGRVGILGFCMGGALTFASVRAIEGLACAVPFYGLPQAVPADFAKVKTPISAHFAKKDDWAKAGVAEEIQKAVTAGGGQMELYVYDAGHAFMRDGDPSHYDEAASSLAWQRALAFLKKHLS
jgi:carboxymethylenebutenolidase